MAHSLEIRVPLVDHELVERVFPLPDRVKIGLWQRKRLLKRALRGRLPEQHFHAPKRGFGAPTAEWLRHELHDMIADELAPGRLRRLGYFDPGVVGTLLEDHFARRHNREGILWALLCFSLWHRAYLYFFERALTDALRRARGDPAVAVSLPWWDWTSATSHHAGLPAGYATDRRLPGQRDRPAARGGGAVLPPVPPVNRRPPSLRGTPRCSSLPTARLKSLRSKKTR